MSSGKGIRTEKGRCFPFFEALENCRTGALLPDLECREFFDDYMECLHHKKEIAHMKAVIRQIESQGGTANLGQNTSS